MTAVSTFIVTGSILTFFVTLLAAAMAYPVTVYPSLAARRSLVTTPSRLRPQTSLSSLMFSTITSRRILCFLATYVSYGTTLSTVYCFLVTLGKPSREFGLWSPTPRHPWHLNERYIFLVFGNSLLFLLLGIQDLVKRRTDPVWPRKKIPLWILTREAIPASMDRALQINSTWCIAYSLGSFVMRRWIWRFVLAHFGGLLRPFIINFTRSSRNSITWSLIPHLLLLEMMSVFAMRIPSAVVNTHVTQPFNFDPFIRKSALTPDRYLLAALKSQNTYHLHFTLMELLRISHDPVRRETIFSDISKTPLTHEIWTELLLHLGRVNHNLVTRGGSRPLTTSAVPQAVKPPDPRAIPIKQADIFRPVVKKPTTFGLSLLDGPVVRAVPPEPVMRATQATMQIEGKAVEKAKKLQSEVVGRIEATPTGHTALGEAAGWIDAVYGWVGGEWARRSVERSLPDPDVVRLIVDIFATLAVASTEEDTYGHVQQVLPATLEAIVRFRSSVASFESELVAQSVLLGRGQGAAVAEVQIRLGAPQAACEIGIKRTAETFGKSLSAFRFPPSIALTLTEICRPPPNPQEAQGGSSKGQ